MKKNIIIKFLAGISVLSLAASCNYEEINTNPYEMTDEMGKMDGLSLGSYITTMERYVLPVGTQADRTDMINEYQIAYHFRRLLERLFRPGQQLGRRKQQYDILSQQRLVECHIQRLLYQCPSFMEKDKGYFREAQCP